MEILEVLPQMQTQDISTQPAAAPEKDFKDVLAQGLKNDAAANKETGADNAAGSVTDTSGVQKEADAEAVPDEKTDSEIKAVDLISLWQLFIDMQAKAANPESSIENAPVEDADASVDAVAFKECSDIMARVANGDKVSAEALNTVREFIALHAYFLWNYWCNSRSQ